ncbi:MAG TPA: iron-sulfur cluster assembly protein [Candidatus Dormibacteraeota bacterium]|nr:iron-sulfur cluster assembly protein [Candidatus Dormibacteraeota bacterium]
MPRASDPEIARLEWEQIGLFYGPELGIDLPNPGLISSLAVRGGRVMVTLALTSPGRPMGESLPNTVPLDVEAVTGVVETAVGVVFAPSWDPEMMSGPANFAPGWRQAQAMAQIDVRQLVAARGRGLRDDRGGTGGGRASAHEIGGAAGSRLRLHLPHPRRCHGSSHDICRGAVRNLPAVVPVLVYSVTVTEEA